MRVVVIQTQVTMESPSALRSHFVIEQRWWRLTFVLSLLQLGIARGIIALVQEFPEEASVGATHPTGTPSLRGLRFSLHYLPVELTKYAESDGLLQGCQRIRAVQSFGVKRETTKS